MSMVSTSNFAQNLQIKKNGYTFYLRVKHHNISFVKLCTEEYETFNLQESHTEEGNNEELKYIKKKTEIILSAKCLKYLIHQNGGQGVYRAEYRQDKDGDCDYEELLVSADMRTVIMIPRMPGLKRSIVDGLSTSIKQYVWILNLRVDNQTAFGILGY